MSVPTPNFIQRVSGEVSCNDAKPRLDLEFRVLWIPVALVLKGRGSFVGLLKRRGGELLRINFNRSEVLTTTGPTENSP
jgi:hypothetical protein